MLKGKQKKLDKNNNGRIDAEDFKILQGSKKGMRMGGMMYAKTGNMFNQETKNTEALDRAFMTKEQKSKRILEDAKRNLKSAKIKDESLKILNKKTGGYGIARKSGMGLQDESMKPGKVMKARKGRLSEYEKGFDVDPLVRSGKMSRSTADAMDTGINAAMGITGAAGLGAAYKAVSTARKKAKKKEMKKKSKKMTASEGSFRVGGLSRQRLQSISNYKNRKAKEKKEKQQEENIRKTEISPMGARSGKSVDKKDFIKRRLELGSLKSVVDVMRDVKKGQKNPSSVLKKAKGGMLKARSGKLADAMKKLREKAYEKSGKKYKGVGKYGKDEYMIQKKLPGMRTGKAVDTLKVIPTVKGKKQIAKDFSPSRINKKTNKYKDYK